MRKLFIPVLSLLLSSCAVVTTFGTEETVSFSGDKAATEKSQLVLKPHNDLPLSIEFSCPTKLATAMTSTLIPLPPFVPIGFVNEHVSYVRITTPEDAAYAKAPIRIITAQGQSIPLQDGAQSKRVVKSNEATEITYALNKDCEAFDGSVLEVAAFSYGNKEYPATRTRLEFDSRLKLHIGPGIVGALRKG